MRIEQFISDPSTERLMGVLLLVDLDGSILDATPAATDRYGYDREELLGLNVSDLAAPHGALTIDGLRAAAERGECVAVDHRRRDGSVFGVELRAVSVRAEGGTALLVSVVDTTGRPCDDTRIRITSAETSSGESAVRENEAKYRMITENSSEVIWTLDPLTRRFLYVSPSVQQLRGFTPEEVVAEPLDAALTLEGLEVVEGFIAEGIAAFYAGSELAQRSYVNEIEQPCKDGTTVWTEVVTRVHLNEVTGRLEVHGVTRDISARKEVEQELRIYATLLDATPAAVTVHTPQGEILYANKRACELHGYSPEEFMELNLRELLVPEDAARFDERVGVVDEAGETSFEVAHYRKDGSTFQLAVNTRRASWAGREIILAVSTDITERQCAEEALLRSRNMLVNLTDQVPGVVYQYLLHPDGRSCFPWSSRGMVDIYEVSPDEVREDATPVFGRLHPEDHDRVSAAIAESARTLEPYHCEYRVVLPRQGMRWRWCDALPERTEDGGTLWYGIITDITERKEAAKALVESAERHRAILQTAMDGFWLVDMDGRLLEVNEAYCEMSGYSEPELLGMRISDLSVLEDAETNVSHIRRIVDAGEDRFESRHRRKDGTIFDIEVSAHYEPSNGGRLAVFLRDITETKRAADRLARSLASIIEVVGQVVETRDPYTAGHERRVSQLAMSIAREMGLDSRQVEEIRVSALIHDVGKISVPAEILSKPGRLSDIEFELIKGHSESGYQILSSADMDEAITQMVYQHHERCDGSGYPRGLGEDEIIEGAKVLMVADVVEAMISHRPYRAGLGLEAALAEISRGAGVLYDAAVVEACLVCFRERGFAFSDA